jgi:hypothetical protein
MNAADQRINDHGRHARRNWRELFDRILPLIVIALVLLFAIVSVLSYGVYTNAHNAKVAADKATIATRDARHALARQRLTGINGCERVQLVRDDQNVIAWGIYTVLNQKPVNNADIARLFAAVDKPTRDLILALTARGQQSRPLYERVRKSQPYLPPTDCQVASVNPRYRFPQPVPFKMVAKCYDPRSIATSRLPVEVIIDPDGPCRRP